MGDINSAKGVEYCEKIKKDFKQKVELLKKKNAQATKDTIIQALDKCVAQNLKVKIQQGLYKSFADMKFDFEQLKNEITLSTSQGFAVKEHAYEYLFTKVLSLTEDFLSDRETGHSNQLRIL